MESQEENQVGPVSSLNITLGELVVFINWMQQAEKSMSQGQRLPIAPQLTQGAVNRWVQMVLRQETALLEMKAKHEALQHTLLVQENQLGSLTSDLCEKLAGLYENLGELEKAEAVRSKLPGPTPSS